MEIIGRSIARCFLAFPAIAMLFGCSGGESKAPPQPASVSVYKTAGAVQCTGGGLSIEDLRRQLDSAEISIHSAGCGSDGKMYPAACGQPDGQIGIFEVPESQVQAAAKLGFAQLSELPDARKSPCQ
jgi:hypothetical protein